MLNNYNVKYMPQIIKSCRVVYIIWIYLIYYTDLEGFNKSHFCVKSGEYIQNYPQEKQAKLKTHFGFLQSKTDSIYSYDKFSVKNKGMLT